jgi:V/A-type H+/Na+-transporting ATPase subunit I
MGVARLAKSTLVIPRIEAQEAVSELAKLEWFHSLPNPSDHPNPKFDDLLLRAQKLYQELDEVIRALGIPIETGVMATMFKGAPKIKSEYEIDNMESFVSDLEEKSKSFLEGSRKILSEQNEIIKELEEYESIHDTLSQTSNLDMNISSFSKLKKFFINLFVIDTADEPEIRKSLGETFVDTRKLNEQKSSLIVIDSAEDSERITKILRSFGVHPFQIPDNLAQNPNEAFIQVKSKITELKKKSLEIEKIIVKTRKSILSSSLSLHESAKVAKDILEATRKPGGTRNFATIQGYIPKEMSSKFKQLTQNYVSILEEPPLTNGEEPSNLPSLLQNKKYTNTFEVITETQGLPRYGEMDPTPIVAFVWPLFYGLMFADLGHGLLLFGLGMLLRHRGNGSIQTWGTLLAASGAAAALAGLGTGELFGFHVTKLAILAPIFAPLGSFVGILSVSELTFDQVVKILKVSIAIGIVHLLMAFFFRLRQNIKDGNKLMIYYHDIPTIIQYFAVVSLILAAIGSGYDIIGMFGITGETHNEPVPWLTFIFGKWVTVDVVAKAAPPVIIACVIVMIIGGMKEQAHMRKLGKDEGGGLVGIIVEVIMVRIIEMLSNTISYSRIGIMLLVHSALLVTVNDSFEHGGGLAVLIGGNIGIMLIEGLIVYIQTIRLHLYEWFPKWYSGDGTEFKRLVPKTLHSNLVWKNNQKS